MTYGVENARFQDVTGSPDGKRLASVGDDRIVRIWETASSKVLWQSQPLEHVFSHVAWSPDSKWIAARAGNVLQVWEAESRQTRRLPPPPQAVTIIGWSPDSKLVVIYAAGLTFGLDLTRDKAQWVQLLPPGKRWVLPQWSPDGKKIVCLEGDTLEVRDAAMRELLHRLEVNLEVGFVTYSSWSPDSKILVYCARDGSMRFWDIEKGEPAGVRLELIGRRYVVLSPDGHFAGTPQIERQLVIVVLTDDGRQEMLTPAEFEQKYGWKNDPDKARLIEK